MKNIILSASAMLLMAIGMTFAQEGSQEKLNTGITLSYYKHDDNTKAIRANVWMKKGKKRSPLSNVLLHFYLKSTENNLGDITTGNNGEALLEVPQDKVVADSLGNFNFIVKFNGNDSCESAEESITVRDARLEITTSLIDSVKTISVTANEVINGKETPIEGADVTFYVKRYFGNLKMGNGALEKGKCGTEFPYNDLNGDSAGNVVLIIKIEDNETYGNVEKKAVVNWGVPFTYDVYKSGINTTLLPGTGSTESTDTMFLAIGIVFIILIIIAIIAYKRY